MLVVSGKTLRHISVVVAPFLIGVATVLLWKFCLYDNGISFKPEAETPILYMIIPPVGFIYVIFASLAVNSVFDKYKQIARSVVRKDIDTYLERRDQQLPGLMHILVAMPSLVLLFLVVTYRYADFYAGVATVFLVTFVVSLTWMVIHELDNTHKRSYFRATVPPHWHTKQPHKHFQEASSRPQHLPKS